MENLDEREEMERKVIPGALDQDRWCYDGKEIPIERGGKIWGAGAGGARKMWDYFEAQHRTETELMVHCQGCKFLQTAGSFLICGYLLATGKRRPCPFGGPCKAKKLVRGYRLPEDYEKRLAAAEAKKARKNAGTAEKREPGKRGPKRGWDEDYAICLHKKGLMLSEISRVMGVGQGALRKAGISHGWYHPGHSGIRSHRDLEPEIARFQEYMKEKSNGGK